MRLLYLKKREGGQSGLPFAIVPQIQTRSLLRFGIGLCLACGLGLGVWSVGPADGQNRNPRANRFPKPIRVDRPNSAAADAARRQNQIRLAQEREAISLLRMMLHPLAEYAGEE